MKNARIEFRLSDEDKAGFMAEANESGVPYQRLLRMWIRAFIKGRLRSRGVKSNTDWINSEK